MNAMDIMVLPLQEDRNDVEQKQGSESTLFEDEIVKYENITVKFRISDTQVVAQAYPNCLTVGEVKIDIGRKFEVEPKYLCLKQTNKILEDDRTLLSTSPNEFGIYEFGLEIVLPTDEISNVKIYPVPELNLQTYYSKFRLADFITVHITGEKNFSCCARDIVVEIQNQAIIKPFLGGYRNSETGIEYFDAFTQTGPFNKISEIYSRDVQTAELIEKSADTMIDESTQAFGLAGEIIFVSSATDFTICPKKYESDQQKKCREQKLKKIILLQRNIRRYLLYKNVQRAAKKYRQLVANRLEYDQEFEQKKKSRAQIGNIVKTFPRTKDDFDILYGQVQRWKEAELKKITQLYTGATRIAEVNILLDKEIQLLGGIEKQRQLVRDAIKECRENKLLKKMGEPVKWVGYKERVVEMDLIRTQRVRFLTEIYNDLKKRVKHKSERLKLLNSVKEVLNDERDCPQTEEALDLFEREQNLLLMTKWCDVEVLRKRQLVLFLEIIKFTKEKLSQDKQTKMCEVCKVIKTVDKFALRTRQNAVDSCKSCVNLKKKSLDNSAYKAILRSIQRDERRKNTLASYAFILQVDDIRFLIDTIWHGHSALSKSNDIMELRLPRWIKSEEWSPWNCVCLTETETRNHINLDTLENVYDEKMRNDIASSQLLAKTAFKKLIATDIEFVETRAWWEVGIHDKIV